MANKDDSKGAVKLPKFTKLNAAEEIQRIANEESEKVFFTVHAEMRMMERDITVRQVLNAIRSGICDSEVCWDTEKEKGWSVSFARAAAGDMIKVAVKLIDRDETVCLVITTWS